jgi:DNA-binding response OmpR family regulator
MIPENTIILLLEDSSHTGMMIQSAVLMSLPECRLVWVRTIEEARTILCDSPIAVFLVDVELPDGNGIDFLMEAALIQPEARAMVMTGNPLPVYRERTEALGGVRFFEKPVPPGELLRCLREFLTANGGASGDRAFYGTIKNLTPIDLIQLKCMANATTVIHFRSAAGDGRVYFESGRMVHAETSDATGEKALNKLVSFTGGTVVEEVSRPVTRTLHQDWQTLLMNAAHAQDVRTAGEA